MIKDNSARRLVRLERHRIIEVWARRNLPLIRAESAKLADCIESNIRLNWKSWHTRQAMRAGEYLLAGDRRQAGIMYANLTGIDLDWNIERPERGYHPKFKSKRVEFSGDIKAMWE